MCIRDSYKGTNVDYLPFSILEENITPIYEEIDGWQEDITKVNTYEDLPPNFKNYIKFLEDRLKLKIKIISVGPDRKQTILV